MLLLAQELTLSVTHRVSTNNSYQLLEVFVGQSARVPSFFSASLGEAFSEFTYVLLVRQQIKTKLDKYKHLGRVVAMQPARPDLAAVLYDSGA